VIDTPYRSLRLLTNYIHLRQSPLEPVETYSCVIRKVPKHDISGGLSIWNVEPREVWDPEQRIISLHGGDKRHVVLHLWRRKGEGYAIILDYVHLPNYQIRRWEYCVFQETSDQPRSYDFYSRSERSTLFRIQDDIRTLDIKINEGKVVEPVHSPSFQIQIIDIELMRDAARSMDEPGPHAEKSSIPEPTTEMVPWQRHMDRMEDLLLLDVPVSG
jgi:hypothetical protein